VPFDLPLAEPDPQLTERADAARNRRRILAAAAALVDERGIAAVSMQDVARAACVGTGTLYRRFGDRAGLALALLDEHTRAFQDALIAGPPPLGPGAPAAERLHAFGGGYLGLLERHAEILLAASPLGRDGGAPQELMVTHLVILLREAAPHVDAEFAARSLLASLGPGQFLDQRRRLGWSVERVREGWGELVDGLLCRSSASG
jgi:AcrR family transcriptional regulator